MKTKIKITKAPAQNQSEKVQKVGAKEILKILKMTDKSSTLSELVRLYLEDKKLKGAQEKLKQKRKEIREKIKQTTAVQKPEQFTFKF